MIPQVHNFSFGNFVWWMGVVENRMDDPEKLGHVRVRIFGYHTSDKGEIPTEDLPWAIVTLPTNSATLKGIGQSPVGIQEGTHVMGFFADGDDAQVPIILATIPGMSKPASGVTSSSGGGAAVKDTNNLARGENLQDTVIGKKKSDVLTSIAERSPRDLASLTEIVSDLTDQITNGGIEISGIMNDFQLPAGISSIPGLGDLASIKNNVQSQLAGIQSQIAQVQALGDSLEGISAKAILDGQLAQYTSTLDTLKGYADISQIANLDTVMGLVQGISGATEIMAKAQSALQSISQVANALSSLKGIAGSLLGGSVVGPILNALRGGVLSNRWQELPTVADPSYPYNNVTELEGGHVEEWDNTPGKERYHRYHKSGSFVETHPNGTEVKKIVKDKYSITMGDDYLHVDGNVRVNIVGAANVVVNGDAVMQVNGDLAHTVKGDYTLAVGGEMNVAVDGKFSQTSGGKCTIQAPRIDLNK